MDHESARQRRQKGEAQQRQAVESQQRQETDESEQEQAQAETIRQFWDSWSIEERARLEDEALVLATPMQRKMLARGGTLAEVTQKLLLNNYTLKLIKQGI